MEKKNKIRGMFRKKVLVKCPKCEKSHEICFDWTGIVKPRKFCDSCKNILDSDLESEIALSNSGIPYNMDVYASRVMTELRI